ncbi:MAG: FtsL-like putative cell division protein [Bacteroidota bacterium]
MANKIIIENEPEEVVEESPKETSRLTNTMQKVADFDFNISREGMLKQIPFALFIVLLLLIHIWNAHNVEKIIRKTDTLNREIKELRSEYISILSELMSESKQSTVASKLDTLGIKELTTPPYKITQPSGN